MIIHPRGLHLWMPRWKKTLIVKRKTYYNRGSPTALPVVGAAPAFEKKRWRHGKVKKELATKCWMRGFRLRHRPEFDGVSFRHSGNLVQDTAGMLGRTTQLTTWKIGQPKKTHAVQSFWSEIITPPYIDSKLLARNLSSSFVRTLAQTSYSI